VPAHPDGQGRHRLRRAGGRRARRGQSARLNLRSTPLRSLRAWRSFRALIPDVRSRIARRHPRRMRALSTSATSPQGTMSADQGPLPPFPAFGLPEPLLAALREVGYESPSPIQAATIPPLMAGHDVIGQAQTGTGKTAAFALPAL